MKPLRAVLLIIVSAILASSASQATTGMNIGPLADVDELSIEEVIVGDTLADDHNRASTLFGEAQGAKAFKTALVSRVAERLKSNGLRLVQNPTISTVALGFGVFGGKFEGSGCDAKNFFLLEVWVYRPEEVQTCPSRTILGVVDDANLPSTLIDSAVKVVDEFLNERKRWRDWQASGQSDLKPAVKTPVPVPSGEVKVEFGQFALHACADNQGSTVPTLHGVPSVDYPEIARKARMEGTVAVKGRILESGAVESVEISKGVNPMLDASATRGLQALVFQPARGGQAVEATFSAVVRFSLH